MWKNQAPNYALQNTFIRCKNQRRIVIYINSIYVCTFVNQHLDSFLKTFAWMDNLLD